MISRRRFLKISAATALVGTNTPTHASNWQGKAFGADVSIDLIGNGDLAQPALTVALDTIRRMERLFSLYDPASSLSRLNRTGKLTMPVEFTRLMSICDRVHGLTGGLFDPTVQPLFAAMLDHGGALPETERRRLESAIGWAKVTRSGNRIRFARDGMALTLNGIAQGFATDRVTEVLAAHGFHDPVVNIGEYRVGKAPARIDIADGRGKTLAHRTMSQSAIATTSSTGYTFADGTSHVLRPDTLLQQRTWQTVSVQAKTAAMADGLSTALCLSPNADLAYELIRKKAAIAVLFEDRSGNIQEFAENDS